MRVKLLIRFALVRNHDDFKKTSRQLVYIISFYWCWLLFCHTHFCYCSSCSLFPPAATCRCTLFAPNSLQLQFFSFFKHTHLQSSFCCWRKNHTQFMIINIIQTVSIISISFVRRGERSHVHVDITGWSWKKNNNTLVAITWLTRKCPFEFHLKLPIQCRKLS